MAEMILAAVEDLIFLSKILETAQRLGVRVEPVDLKDLKERALRSAARAVILDLNHRSGSALEVLQSFKADPSTSRLPVVGFVSHVQSEVIAAARAAGCDQVLARSALAAQLPQLLERLAGKEAAKSPDLRRT